MSPVTSEKDTQGSLSMNFLDWLTATTYLNISAIF